LDLQGQAHCQSGDRDLFLKSLELTLNLIRVCLWNKKRNQFGGTGLCNVVIAP
jgi:hypothetical protein